MLVISICVLKTKIIPFYRKSEIKTRNQARFAVTTLTTIKLKIITSVCMVGGNLVLSMSKKY